MADLDPVIQEILLEGNGEVLRGLQEIGEKGAEALKSLSEAAEGGAGSLGNFANGVAGIVAVVSTAATTLAAFVESQDEATQRTKFLADAMGATASQVNGLEDAFAAAGVSASTFERFAQRLTTTIAQQWPEITAAVRTGATQQSEAQEAIVAATLKVKAAQDELAFGAEEDANKAEAAALRVATSYQKVQDAAAEAASARIHAEQSVEASQNSVVAAEQRLATLQGNPPTAAAKQALEISQAQLAVDQARTNASDQQRKQQQEAAAEETKAAQVRLDHSNAVLAQQKLEAELANANIQRANAAAEAQDRLATAEEHAAKIALSNLPNITAALGGVVDKNEAMAKSVDLNSVSVQNLNRGIINLAAQANNGIKPTGLQTFNELVKVLSNTTDEMIGKETQLALVMQFGGRSMQQAGASASELLEAIKHGPEYFNSYVSAAGKYYSTTEAGAKAAEDFKKSLESFQQALQLTLRDLAAFASPTMAAFFDSMKESLTSSTGTLHLFVEGVEGIGAALRTLGNSLSEIGVAIEKVFNLAPGRAFQIMLGAALVIIGAFATAWVGIPALILVVVTAIGTVVQNLDGIKKWIADNRAQFVAWGAVISGIITGILLLFAPWSLALGAIIAAVVLIATHWDDIKKAAQGAIDAVTNSPFVKWLDSVIDKLGKLTGLWNSIKSSPSQNKSADGTGQAYVSGPISGAVAGYGSDGQPTGGTPSVPISRAEGGPIRGPGSGTSDSIMARLSNGEFVVRAAAVQRFGEGFMHAINNGVLPGFAMGGLVPSPARLASGSGSGPVSTLNLSIDGRSFNGLRGPKSTVDDLTNYAISRQSSAAGKNPSWLG